MIRSSCQADLRTAEILICVDIVREASSATAWRFFQISSGPYSTAVMSRRLQRGKKTVSTVQRLTMWKER